MLSKLINKLIKSQFYLTSETACFPFSKYMSQNQKSLQTSNTLIEEKQPHQIVIQQTSEKMEKTKFEKLKQQILDKLNSTQCSQHNQSKLICASSHCNNQNLFMCYNWECECVKQHEACCTVQKNYLNKTILNNLIDTQKLIEQVETAFDGVIEFISQKRQSMITQIRTSFGLTQNQAKYMKHFYEKDQESQIQPHLIQKIAKEKLNFKLDRANLAVSRYRNQIQNIQTSLKPYFEKINIKIESFCQTICPQYFNSRIVKTQDQKQFLYKSLKEVVDVQSLVLLYRATQNNFQTQAFQQKCHQKSDLLILVKNQNGKKYGAFTPCTYKKDQVNVFQQDNSMSSFLFTISDKVKFKLLKKQFAMKNGNNQHYIISFGQTKACCMTISTNANTNPINWFNPNSVYESNWFNSSLYKKGENANSLKLLQYEVYQLVKRKTRIFRLFDNTTSIFN